MTNEQYIKDAIRTASGSYYGNHIPIRSLDDSLFSVIALGQQLDTIKKALFYGRDIESFNSKKCTGRKLTNSPQLFGLGQGKGELVLHGIIGTITEAVELAELLEATIIDGKEFDVVNLKEELGDIFWYMAILADTVGFSFEEIQERNIAKLKARFPEKFTEEKAVNRNLNTEREILEGK